MNPTGWLRLHAWQKHHYFVRGRALCGRGVIPYGFNCFNKPRYHHRCKACSALK